MNEPGKDRIPWWGLVVTVVYAVIVLGVGLDGRRVLSRHEVLAAQPAREMLNGAGWMFQSIAGERRVVKPPATSWTIASFMAVFRSDAEWVARMPAMLAGVALVLLITIWCGRHLPPAYAVSAGLLTSTMYYLLLQARLAEADMLLALSMSAAMLSLDRALIPDQGGRTANFLLHACLFGIFAGIATMLKGPVGPSVYLSAAMFAAWTRNRRAWRFVLHPIGLALFVVVGGWWYAAAMWVDPAMKDIFYAETIGRARGEMGGQEPWYFYLWNVPMMILPWLPFVIAGALHWRRVPETRGAIARFVVAWFFPLFVLLSIAAWKHKHYCIPILPPLSLLGAIGLLMWIESTWRTSRGATLAWTLAWIAGCAGAAYAAYTRASAGNLEIAILISVIMAGGVGVIALSRLRDRTLQLGCLFVTAMVVACSANLWVAPYFDGYRDSADLGRRASALADPGETIYLVELGEAHISYYLRFPMRRIDRLSESADLPEQARWVLLPTASVEKLKAAYELEVIGIAGKLRRPDRPFEEVALVRIVRRREP